MVKYGAQPYGSFVYGPDLDPSVDLPGPARDTGAYGPILPGDYVRVNIGTGTQTSTIYGGLYAFVMAREPDPTNPPYYRYFVDSGAGDLGPQLRSINQWVAQADLLKVPRPEPWQLGV